MNNNNRHSLWIILVPALIIFISVTIGNILLVEINKSNANHEEPNNEVTTKQLVEYNNFNLNIEDGYEIKNVIPPNQFQEAIIFCENPKTKNCIIYMIKGDYFIKHNLIVNID